MASGGSLAGGGSLGSLSAAGGRSSSVLSGRAGRLRFPLAPSVAMYAAALMIKGALAL